MNLTKTQKQFVVKIEERFGKSATVTREQVQKIDRKSTRLNSSHIPLSRMPSSA